MHLSYLFNLYLLSLIYLYLSPVTYWFFLFIIFILSLCTYPIYLCFNIKIKFMTYEDLILWLEVWPWRPKWVSILLKMGCSWVTLLVMLRLIYPWVTCWPCWDSFILGILCWSCWDSFILGILVGHVETHLSLGYFVGYVETHLSLGHFLGHVETHLSWLTTTKYNKYNTFIIVECVNLGDLNELLAHLS